MTDLPDPLAPADCDCTDLDSFMFNVERFMVSELVALCTHEEIAAAMFLWCRAWKQRPAASLPDDERVLAAFAKLPLARFRKLRAACLRGFVKCSDGRLYHRVLAIEAVNAYEKKLAFHRRREADSERLRKWREEQRRKARETKSDTGNETRFVAEGQGQGQVPKEERKKDSDLRSAEPRPARTAREALWEDGPPIVTALIGTSPGQARAFLGKLLQASHDDCARVYAVLREAESLKPLEPKAWLVRAAKPPGERDRQEELPVAPSESNPRGVFVQRPANGL